MCDLEINESDISVTDKKIKVDNSLSAVNTTEVFTHAIITGPC